MVMAKAQANLPKAKVKSMQLERKGFKHLLSLRGRGRSRGHGQPRRPRSVPENCANGPAAGSNNSAAPASKVVSLVKLKATGSISQYKTASQKLVALVLSKTEISKE